MLKSSIKMKSFRGLSFLGIMIIIAICGLLLRIAIEQIINISIAQNESDALGTLKLISTALENYAKENNAAYPSNLLVLTRTQPPYLDRDYIADSPLKGYNYSCLRLESTGYSCSAVPLNCNLSGRTVYTVTTGTALLEEECEKKE